MALAQQANLETRQAKHDPRSEAEQREAWRDEAVGVLGSPEAVDRMISAALHSVLDARRATWQVWSSAQSADSNIAVRRDSHEID